MDNKKRITIISLTITALVVFVFMSSQQSSNYQYQDIDPTDNELLAKVSYEVVDLLADADNANAAAIAGFLNGNLPTTTPTGNAGVPNLLSGTGAFSDLIALTPSPGLIPYDMIEPFWSDGADKSRWMAVPNDGTYDTAAEQITYSTDEAWDFPQGSVLIKHFEIGGIRLETRFEVKGTDDVYYYLTYKWNSAQTDAVLLDAAVDEDVTVGGVTQSWHYPSRTECVSCHFPQNGSVLGPKTRNLNKAIFYPSTGLTKNQLVYYSELGLITENITDANVNTYPAVAAKDDLSASLEDRARSYIDVNCSSCHVPNVDNVAMFDARYTTPLANQNLIYGDVVYDEGLTNPKVIIPQDVANSMAHFRMNSTQTGIEMPPIAKDVVDTAGVQLIEDWINSLTPTTSSPPEALFSASTVNGTVPLSVDFDATASTDADGDSLSYSWDFDDGNTGSGVTINHIFTTVGEYTVTLTVNDGLQSDQATTTITVNVSNPGGNTVAFADNTDVYLAEDNFSGLPMGVIDMNGDCKDDIVQFNNARELRIQYQNGPGQLFTSHLHGSVSGSNQWGTVIADFDHNGYNDVMSGGAYDNLKIITNNNGSTSFTQSTLGNSNIFLQGANFADINNDGWADIFACHDDAESRTYENNQDGTLTFNADLLDTETTPASDNSGNYASMWIDYDNDGDLDLYISKCRGGVNDPNDPRRINMLMQNDGNNNFTEVAEQANLKIGEQTWLSDFGDIDNDGDLDAIVINHFSGPNLMRNNGDGTFTEVTAGSGLMPTLDPANFYGVQGFFKDFNNDGFIDLMVSGDNHYIFYNNGDGTFQNAPNPFGSNQIQSFSVGDINHDGFWDVYAGYANGLNSPSSTKDRIWINQGNSNNFINIQCEGTLSNINGIGARVELHGTWGIQIRDIKSGEGYGLVNSFTQHFGLGVSNQIEKVVVKWPSGIVDEILNPSINQFLKIVETEPDPTCDDGFQNGDETGVDCGGSFCDECPPTCDDGIQNGDETGVDCGGSSCDPCPVPCTENDIIVSITFDDYPEETSWAILDSTSATVASGGTYAEQADGSTLDIEVCLPDGCYDFVINDTFGDGICCQYGNGSYIVTANGDTVASGASFTNSETTNFCLGDVPCEGEDLSVITIDFENGNGTDWTTSGTATTGAFVIADPTAQTTSGIQTQPEDDHSPSGINAFFTATNTAAGTDDIDGGTAIATSPVYNIPDNSNLSIWYFFGQRDAGDDAGDFFLLEYSIDGGTNYMTLASHGDETVQAFWTQATASIPAGSSLVIRVSAADGTAGGDIIEAGIDDLVVTKVCEEPIVYTFNNNVWSPSDPNNVSSSNDTIVIMDGNAVISMDTSIDAITVEAGAALTINSGVTLTANTTTLTSTSLVYSSLILDGTLTGTVNYERHVNINGSGETGSNDLISAPLTGQQFDDFVLANPNILNNGTLYLFGPFDKVAGDYTLYNGTSTVTLDAGIGYRAASSDNDTFTFTGTANSGMITHDITNSGPVEVAQWNLVGNPYPSYLNVWDFLTHEVSPGVMNIQLMNAATAAVYGYDGDISDGWTIYNLATITPTTLIAPGQGFFVSADPTNAPLYDLQFMPAMRATGTSDDFIQGRNQSSVLSSLVLSNSERSHNTRIYFIEGTTRGLDHGYDACDFGDAPDEFSIFTNLVEGNSYMEIAVQSLPYNDFNNVVVPLGIKAAQGTELTISLGNNSTLPDDVNVYLEDTLFNTVTLLNESDFVFTPDSALTGTGRFFLRYSADTLTETTFELDDILIFADNDNRDIIVKGQLAEFNNLKIYDLQGRLVRTQMLDHTILTNKVNVSTFSTGVYLVQLSNGSASKTKKLVIE